MRRDAPCTSPLEEKNKELLKPPQRQRYRRDVQNLRPSFAAKMSDPVWKAGEGCILDFWAVRLCVFFPALTPTHAHIHSSVRYRRLKSSEVKPRPQVTTQGGKKPNNGSYSQWCHIVEFSRRLPWTFRNKKIASESKTWNKLKA